jgi:hypothetical protein
MVQSLVIAFWVQSSAGTVSCREAQYPELRNKNGSTNEVNWSKMTKTCQKINKTYH